MRDASIGQRLDLAFDYQGYVYLAVHGAAGYREDTTPYVSTGACGLPGVMHDHEAFVQVIASETVLR